MSASVSTSEGVPIISDKEIADVVDVLGINEVKHVYEKLGITYDEVEKAEAEVNSNSPTLKAKAVFRKWRQENAKTATKNAVLDALEACKFMNSMQKLKKKWNM